MQFSEDKKLLHREIVKNGWERHTQVPLDFRENIGDQRVQRWFNRFYRDTGPGELVSQPRLLNHFTIGADPEMSFYDAGSGRFRDAVRFGLQAGLPYGADNNSRLVEFRPSPSRSALEIVANILVEMRWLATMHPDTTNYSWMAAPYDGRDGCGGHVHLGRKKPRQWQANEVAALDNLNTMFQRIGLFNQGLCAQRIKYTHYGRGGDIRPQKHGYEYRSFPTWIGSPALAFLSLTLAKLLVLDPQLPINFNTPKITIKNLLAYYRGLDDDARLAYYLYMNYPIAPRINDIRAAWGIPLNNLHLRRPYEIELFPSTIHANGNEISEMFQALVGNHPLDWRYPKSYWEPTCAPAGFVPLLSLSSTVRQPGIGEIAYDMLVSKELTFGLCAYVKVKHYAINLSNHIAQFVDLRQANLLGKQMFGPTFKLTAQRFAERQDFMYISLPLRSSRNISKLREYLSSGLFPMWKVEDVYSKRIVPRLDFFKKAPERHVSRKATELFRYSSL